MKASHSLLVLPSQISERLYSDISNGKQGSASERLSKKEIQFIAHQRYKRICIKFVV
jgi:hypothetical protein